MITSKDIEKETEILRKRIGIIEEKSKKITETGRLRICRKARRTDFYCVIEKGDTKGTYIPKTDIARARSLAQKDYYERVLKIMKRKYRALAMLNGQNANDALLEAYEKLHPVRRGLVEPVILTDEEYVEKWREDNPPSGRFKDDDESLYYTDNGERVRSKSEIMIANKFFQRGIPYVYEPALVLGERTVHPDFKVLNIRTRQSFYYEHLGMMDSADYAAKAVMKINSYIISGYLPGQGLLFTMESAERPLDMRVLEAMIDEFLV